MPKERSIVSFGTPYKFAIRSCEALSSYLQSTSASQALRLRYPTDKLPLVLQGICAKLVHLLCEQLRCAAPYILNVTRIRTCSEGALQLFLVQSLFVGALQYGGLVHFSGVLCTGQEKQEAFSLTENWGCLCVPLSYAKLVRRSFAIRRTE